ncbi:tyrosine-protein phosphatase [Listeria ivanovii]|uniref:Protein tyrosine phosphatase n=1 Tax=Listeria ivanovii (strain ATCC BAA-678 / PAM 55) TaxID=881621 RepID=G2ZBH5_LISIP|nr:tyrosine-protein phosphatase [Listeria ivanovii]MBK3914253.1 tyrosine-protein phosphatase [Listeria ivanovii subsp. ivanovii]MBK3920909.1 tyrosine-protein phosphatase [Listeria ivanovii subsp. ivanovii]MBK3926073.1 tyrosine-protein phosphatase [Listeria ivanovii subsp. ivanovii]MCJ1717304.1 tyrosine-protein phosphatase [Listeria ivanovii]MCJ1722511.1 tyrosine-protein phosphatase [Listeria ivanovii]
MKNWVKVTGAGILTATLLLGGCGNQSEERAEANAETTKSLQPGSQIKLEGAVNVRDLGGYKTTDGLIIKPHKLIRSAELVTLSDSDKKKLVNTYNLSHIVDFRTNSEVEAKPDPTMTNVDYTHDSVMKDNGTSTSTQDLTASLATMDNPETFLIEANKSFITDDTSIQAYKDFFNVLLSNQDGSVLWHCTAGKDRAGFGTALVLSALGVEKETVIDDYMLSNKYRAAENKKAIAAVAAKTDNQKVVDGMTAVMEVRESYINAAFDEIDSKYGSMDNFFKDKLELTEVKQEQLKKMYLY